VDVTTLLGWAFLANADRQALDADYSALRQLEIRGLFEIEALTGQGAVVA
jgi:hypothetical protein